MKVNQNTFTVELTFEEQNDIMHRVANAFFTDQAINLDTKPLNDYNNEEIKVAFDELQRMFEENSAIALARKLELLCNRDPQKASLYHNIILSAANVPYCNRTITIPEELDKAVALEIINSEAKRFTNYIKI